MALHNEQYEKMFVATLRVLVLEGHQVWARPTQMFLGRYTRWRWLNAEVWHQRECHFFISPGDPDLRCTHCRPERLVMARIRGREDVLVRVS